MSNLKTLADRVEAGGVDERELFEDVWRELFPKPERIWITDNDGDWTPEYAAWIERQHRYYDLLEAGAFLDAAMTLIPANSLWSTGDDIDGAFARLCIPVGIGYLGGEMDAVFAKTPALALTAACLRARSRISNPEGDGV